MKKMHFVLSKIYIESELNTDVCWSKVDTSLCWEWPSILESGGLDPFVLTCLAF